MHGLPPHGGGARHGHGEEHEGIERDRGFVAAWTLEAGFELSLEQVDNDGAIAFLVQGPGFVGHDMIGPPVAVDGLGVGLGDHLVQVLVEAVQQEGEQFRGVLLRQPTETAAGLSDNAFERVRSQDLFPSSPHLLQ